jgi:PAS domain-containing protein
VINSMNSGLLITDMTGRVVSSNHAAERILMLTPGAQRRWSAQDIFSFVDIDDLLHKTERLDQRLNRTERLCERGDGQKIILGLSYSPCAMRRGRCTA